MSSSEREGDTKRTSLRPEPLSLFCFPEDTSSCFFGRTTYVNPLPKKEPEIRWLNRKTEREVSEGVRSREREEYWLRKRTEARIRRRRMKEPIRHLKSYLLTTVTNEKVPEKTIVSSLFEVLETVKDAWPPPPSANFSVFRREDPKPPETKNVTPKPAKMKDQNSKFSSPLLNRRFSVPEELMRKYSMSKERTSEESETNKTTIEITSSSPSTLEAEETARRNSVKRQEVKDAKEETLRNMETARLHRGKMDACQQTSDSEDGRRSEEPTKLPEIPKRVTQADYYNQGKRIIKVKAMEASHVSTCTCGMEKASTTTASAKEDTDESITSESIPSSSPIQLPKHDSSSENLSSESDCLRCTCAELTSSKETSTDLFHSGKSTLSQTVSEKSVSTQDSTVSINSISTRGSTVSDNSNSTTPEIERTSAKETTTSPDYSPRTPRSNMNRKNRRRDRYQPHYHKKTCPRYHDVKHSRNYLSTTYRRQCPVHSEYPNEQDKTSERNREFSDVESRKEDSTTKVPREMNQINEVESPTLSQNGHVPETEQRTQAEATQVEFVPQEPAEDRYKWAKLSQEELYMMQRLRHQKFVENQRRFSTPLSSTPDADSVSVCGTGSVYKETEYLDQLIMIPRYSALPRTLSMLVNTSSAETSNHNSDSDNQSLADSLEDQPITHVHRLFDTKKESKPVRGDINMVPDTKPKHRQPRGRAFFVSIKDPYGEDEMLESIEKIPQPPDKIKNQIFERHLKICAKHKQLHKSQPKVDQKPTIETTQKKRKTRNVKNEETERSKKYSSTDSRQEPPKHNHRHQKNVNRPDVDSEEHKKLPEVRAKGSEEHKQAKTNSSKIGASEEPKTTAKRKRETKDRKGTFNSKIPVPVSRSTSSSPERDLDAEEKPARPRISIRREKENKETSETTAREGNPQNQTLSKPLEFETTQILEISQNGSELSLHKPHAVIHPSQIPFNDSKFESKEHVTMPPLVTTLKVPSFQPPFRQNWNKQVLVTQARRSPIGKFRQRFEVIPEEKSSSLSSAEEKNGREPLPKFADASTSPPLQENQKNSDKIQFQSYNVTEVPNIIVAKFTNKQLETLPYVKNNDNQKIILFSSKPQNSNSSKGRDALIAMNREDFTRLAKGWMNFYKLNENCENSETEDNAKPNKTKEARLEEAIGKTKTSATHTETTKTEAECPKTKKTERNTEKPDQKTSRAVETSGKTGNKESNCSGENNLNSFQPKTTEGKQIESSKPKQTDKCTTTLEAKREVKNNSSQVEFRGKEVPTSPKKENGPVIDENIRFHSSNTILRTVKPPSPNKSGRNIERQSSLPELKMATERNWRGRKSKACLEALPKESRFLEDDDDTDSDSTDYMEPPSPRVPPLPLGDFPSDATLSSTDSDLDDPKPQMPTQALKPFQLKKRGTTNRTKSKKINSFEGSTFGKKKNSGWSVTVAGTVELSKSAPDLEMRLSFPMKGGPPVVCQSDSGFAEDSNYSKVSESIQDLDFCTLRKELPLDSGNMKQKWTVTVKNPKQGAAPELAIQKLPNNSNYHLPDLESPQKRNAKKVLKETQVEEALKYVIERKLHSIWPKIQRLLQKELLTESGRLITEFQDGGSDVCLSIRGNAISLERKQKPPTMTERDITRRYNTSRTEPPT